MKQFIAALSIASLLVLGFSACKKKSSTKDKDLFTIEIPYTKGKVLPAIDTPFNLVSWPIDLTDTFATQVDEFLALYANGLPKSKIISLNAETMNVTVVNPTAQTLNFVDDSVKVYVDKYNGTSPVLVAYKKGIPANAKSIEFDIIKTDIKDLFYDPYMQVTMKFNTKANEKVLDGAYFVSNFKFKIIADPN